MTQGLGQTFREHARVAVALPADAGALEAMLEQQLQAARAAWPGVELPAEVFARHVAERLPAASEGKPVERALDGMALCDLYLACACAEGVPRAAEQLEARFLARLPEILRRQFRKASTAEIEDVCQLVREELLMGTPERGPHLRSYSGEGALWSWIRIIAARKASRRLSTGRPPDEELVPDLLPPGGRNQEQSAIRSELQQKLREAVREAVSAATSKDDRYLLRLHYRERLSTVELVKVFGTSQPTISRRLMRIRAAILVEARRQMQERHGVGEQELKDFLADQSRIDMTLSVIFSSAAE
ncbi:MAG TPA: sigma-70 family RNA polymerase sigma factor [Myxococcales bacterium]|nr:sigma-70 family RNA polymerase sigma factor [Myxococcales bacterium]